MSGSLVDVHMSIGPVQGFVAQARRTRDLLVGSFLLSYLSACAVAEVYRRGGHVVYPAIGRTGDDIQDGLVRAVLEGQWPEGAPFIGSVPNRFHAKLPAHVGPDELVTALCEAWRRIANAVWTEFVEPVAACGNGTRTIWDRQVEGFWEVMWAVGDATVLDRRKNWRTYVPTVEPGDKCMLIPTLQELSGYERHANREAQDAFWRALRSKLRARELAYELQPNERLCAIALIKRLVVHVARKAFGWPIPEDVVRFPSTSYLAAVPWLKDVARKVARNDMLVKRLADYVALAERVGDAMGRGVWEHGTVIPSIAETVTAIGQGDERAARFWRLNGNFYFQSDLGNPRLWEGTVDDARRWEDVRRLRDALLKEWEGRQRSERWGLRGQIGEPSPFYAVLLMDGDLMGHVRETVGAETVARSLEAFSKEVPQRIRDHDGLLIYAGGDDVLALLPLDTALDAAVTLQRDYRNAFAREGATATISAAVVFAHHHLPLQNVIRSAHELLDDVAKEQTGRDSLAVAVWKASGSVITWAAPWAAALEGERETSTMTYVQRLAAHLARATEQAEERFSSAFFYKLRDTYEVLWGADRENPLNDEERKTLHTLLVAEFVRSFGRHYKKDINRAQAEQAIELLLKVCLRSWRDEAAVVHFWKGGFSVDGALVARFLAQKGASGA